MIHLLSNLWKPSLPDSQWHLHSWKNLELWVYYLLLAASFDMPLTAKATQSSKPACLWILCKCPHNLCQPCSSNVKSSCHRKIHTPFQHSVQNTRAMTSTNAAKGAWAHMRSQELVCPHVLSTLKKLLSHAVSIWDFDMTPSRPCK